MFWGCYVCFVVVGCFRVCCCVLLVCGFAGCLFGFVVVGWELGCVGFVVVLWCCRLIVLVCWHSMSCNQFVCCVDLRLGRDVCNCCCCVTSGFGLLCLYVHWCWVGSVAWLELCCLLVIRYLVCVVFPWIICGDWQFACYVVGLYNGQIFWLDSWLCWLDVAMLGNC